MHKKILIAFALISTTIFSCSKSDSAPTTPVVSNLKVKYEMIFSSPLTAYPPTFIGTSAIFRVTYMDFAGNGAQTLPNLAGTSWSQDVTVTSKTRPIDLGFETTSFFVSAKGTIISNIYVNDALWKTRTDSTVTRLIDNKNYYNSAVKTFYFPYTN